MREHYRMGPLSLQAASRASVKRLAYLMMNFLITMSACLLHLSRH